MAETYLEMSPASESELKGLESESHDRADGDNPLHISFFSNS
jgi:hypothetical protein